MISELSLGEGITRTRLNEIIRGMNKLEDANRFNGMFRSSTGAVFSSADYNILVQGITATITDKTPDSIIGTITYPKPFITRPAVTVTLNSYGSYKLVPFIQTSTATSCTVRVARIEPGYDFPATVNLNIIAIGPVA